MMVETGRCTGCGRCISACPKRLFAMEVSGYRKAATVADAAPCDRCLKCLPICPVQAIGDGGAAADMA